MRRLLPPPVPSRPAAPGRRGPTSFSLLSALAAVTAIAAACGGGEAAPAAVHSYTVEGEVLYLPTESVPAVTIRHQAIDDFVDMDGEVVGMDAMTMPFPVADGVSLAGIDSGDSVRFTLEVEWDGDVPYRISQIEELAGAG